MSRPPEISVRLLLTRKHSKQRRLARAVGSNDANDAAGRQGEIDIFVEQPVAIAFGEALRFDDHRTETLGDRNDDLRRAAALFL